MLINFLRDRLLFSGLPFGDLRSSVERAISQGKWAKAFTELAFDYEARAVLAERHLHIESARVLWRWAAISHQGASFEVHVAPHLHHDYQLVECARRRAQTAFKKSLAYEAGPTANRSVVIWARGRVLDGYYSSGCAASPCVILLNGLDSIAEVELEAFAQWFRARGVAVLTLNIPVAYDSTDRSPLVDVRDLVEDICDWLQTESGSRQCGVFGVSFGGHLVAQFLSADSRVICGGSICPPAYLGVDELKSERMRVMWSCALRQPFECAYAHTQSLPDVRELPPPQGNIMLIGCHGDQVFGEEHIEAYRSWGQDRLTLRMLSAEHVATSRYSEWLPDVCDWICGHFAATTLEQVA